MPHPFHVLCEMGGRPRNLPYGNCENALTTLIFNKKAASGAARCPISRFSDMSNRESLPAPASRPGPAKDTSHPCAVHPAAVPSPPPHRRRLQIIMVSWSTIKVVSRVALD